MAQGQKIHKSSRDKTRCNPHLINRVSVKNGVRMHLALLLVCVLFGPAIILVAFYTCLYSFF